MRRCILHVTQCYISVSRYLNPLRTHFPVISYCLCVLPDYVLLYSSVMCQCNNSHMTWVWQTLQLQKVKLHLIESFIFWNWNTRTKFCLALFFVFYPLVFFTNCLSLHCFVILCNCLGLGIHFDCHTYVSDLHNQLQMTWRFRKLCQNVHYITLLASVSQYFCRTSWIQIRHRFCVVNIIYIIGSGVHNYTAYCLYTPGKRHWCQTLGHWQSI